MKRKKGSRGGFKKVKMNDSLMENNPNSSPFSIEGEDAVDQIDEGQVNFELDVEQPTTAPNKFAKASSSDPVKELHSDRVMVFSDNEKISDLSLPRNSEQM